MNLPRREDRKAVAAVPVLDALGGFAMVVDRDLRILELGRPLREAVGPARGRYCFDVLQGRSEACPDCPARTALARGERILGAEFSPTVARGTTVVPVTAAPLHAEDGAVVGVVVTESPGATSAVAGAVDHERACATLFEEVPCYIVVIDEEFRLARVNRRVRDDFGDPADRLGLRCYELFKRRSEPCLRCPTVATFRDGEPHTSQETLVTASGETREVLVRTAPLLDAEGGVSRVMEMATDITEYQEVKSQLESLGMLVGRIAHEVKGVLTGLDGGVYMVSTGMERHDETRLEKGWGMVRRNVDRVRTLILDMLYYAKDREPKRKLASPIKVLQTVADRFRERAERRGVELELDIDPAAIRFSVDVRAVEALLTNLIENAFDACAPTEGEEAGHHVRLAVENEEAVVRYTVEDDGVGMDAEARAKALTPFFSSKGSSGTGLGLHIAHRIAVQHGGAVELDSELGRGTRITVTLPISAPEPPAPS